MSLRKTGALALVAVLAMAALGACSKKDETTATSSGGQQSASGGNAGATTTTTSKSGGSSSGGDETTTTKKSDKTPTTRSGGSDSIPDLGSAGSCLEASLAYATILIAPLSFMGGAKQSDIDKFKKDVADLKSKIPAELRDDFDIVASAWNDFAAVFGSIDLNDPTIYTDPSKVRKLEEASKLLDSPKVKSAQDRIDAYFKKNCGS